MKLLNFAMTLAVAGCAAQAPLEVAPHFVGPAQSEVKMSSDDLWMRAAQSLALENIPITSSDKQTGVITGAGSFAGKPDYFLCSKGKGRLEKEELSVTLALTPNGPGSTRIQVQAAGKTGWYQKHHVLIVSYGHVSNYVTCESTGKLEALLLQRIQGN